MKKKKKNRKLKLIKRYGIPNMLTGIFALIVAAIAVGMYFFPILEIKVNDQVIVMKGLDVLKGALVYVNPAYLPQQLVDDFALINSETLNLAYPIYFTVLGIVYGLICLWAFIEVIFALCVLIFGRLHRWKGPYGFSWGMLICVLMENGLVYLIGWYLPMEFGDFVTIKVNEGLFYMYAYAVIAFVMMMTLGIFYVVSFKNRIFEKDIDKYTLEETPDPGKVFDVKDGEIVCIKLDLNKQVPYQLTYIQEHAFAKNTELTEAKIPSYVRKIGAGAFANCVNLETLELPAALTSIEYNAFFNCKRLKTITFKGTKDEFKKVARGKNWLAKAGCHQINCQDGFITIK